jgi:hypothetical protein
MSNDINKELANTLLFVDIETGEELRPEGLPEDVHGSLELIASNKDGSRRWKHTIKTEEL